MPEIRSCLRVTCHATLVVLILWIVWQIGRDAKKQRDGSLRWHHICDLILLAVNAKSPPVRAGFADIGKEPYLFLPLAGAGEGCGGAAETPETKWGIALGGSEGPLG
jgi:hypothetical protein